MKNLGLKKMEKYNGGTTSPEDCETMAGWVTGATVAGTIFGGFPGLMIGLVGMLVISAACSQGGQG